MVGRFEDVGSLTIGAVLVSFGVDESTRQAYAIDFREFGVRGPKEYQEHVPVFFVAIR